jgi:hypothetical protein
MFSSAILDVAIGLVFVFMVVSLAASAILEAIAGIVAWRSKTLINGVKNLLNDPQLTGLASQLYQHALVNPLNTGTGTTPAELSKNAPAYIDPKQFAGALIDILNTGTPIPPPPPPPGQPAPPPPPLAPPHPGPMVNGDAASVTAAINHIVPAVNNPQINSFLHGVARRANYDLAPMRDAISSWFDNSMDRVSGVYKRWTQLWHFLIGLAVAIMLNISALHVAKVLWQQPMDTKLVEGLGKADKPLAVTDGIKELDKLPLPIGWSHYKVSTGPEDPADPGGASGVGDLTSLDWAEIVVGWIITGLAALFGAPFWFDLLQQIVRLKGTGPSPKEKQEGTAAAN